MKVFAIACLFAYAQAQGEPTTANMAAGGTTVAGESEIVNDPSASSEQALHDSYEQWADKITWDNLLEMAQGNADVQAIINDLTAQMQAQFVALQADLPDPATLCDNANCPTDIWAQLQIDLAAKWQTTLTVIGTKLENAIVISKAHAEENFRGAAECDPDCYCPAEAEYTGYLNVMLEKDNEITSLENQLNDLYLQLCGIPPNCQYNEVTIGSEGGYHFYDLTDYDNNGEKDYTTYMSDEVQACFAENWAAYESTGEHIEGSGTNGALQSGGASANASSSVVIETGHVESPTVDIDDAMTTGDGSSSSSSYSYSFSSSTDVGEPVVTTTTTTGGSDMYYDDYYDFYGSDDVYTTSDEFNYTYY